MYKSYSELTVSEATQVSDVIDLANGADPWDFVYYVENGNVIYAKSVQQVTA